jgi:hypothetical protein
LDPQTEAARRRMREAEVPLPVIVVDEEPPRRFQFSLRQMLIANTVLAVVLALMQVLAPSVLAGSLGTAAFLLVVVLMIYPTDRPGPHLVWIGLLALYFVVSLVAVYRGR